MNLPSNDSKLLVYDSKLLRHFKPRKSRVKITMVIYPSIIKTLAPGSTLLAQIINSLNYL